MSEDIEFHNYMHAFWQKEVVQPMNAIGAWIREQATNVMRTLATWWKTIKRHLFYLRKHGTGQQKRAAWKLLHPARRRRVSSRRRVA